MGLLRFAGDVVRSLFGTPSSPTEVGVRSKVETREFLAKERLRADRSGQPLAVVVFSFEAGTNPYTGSILARILRERLRVLDEIGWFDDSVLCAVLPSTDWLGAKAVAEHVCELMPAELPHPECSIYIYPRTEEESSATIPIPSQEAPAPLETVLVREYPFWKRAMDIGLATLGLLVLSPLLLIVGILVKVTSSGPIFFRQERRGEGGRAFFMYKFRTMVVDAEAQKNALRAQSEQDGPAFKMKNDPRVTWIGNFLRKTSIDELPQLWNILKGDMALVGPRPLPTAESDRCEAWQKRRLDVRPGLTCLWQVKGRSAVSFADWMRMDLQYLEAQSLPEDLKLLALTVPAVLLRKGAH